MRTKTPDSPRRAMVLAAGFGTRLRPLTELHPKPLVPLANRPLIHYALDQLQEAGLEQVVVNSHHLGEQIPAALGEHYGELKLRFSHESSILGTGGGLMKARHMLDGSTFFLLNGDVLSDVDLLAAWEHHRRGGFAATMVVRALPDGSPYTALEADSSGRLLRFKEHKLPARGSVRPCMFCGIHVLEPQIFDHLPSDGFACINSQAYGSMMDAGMDIGAFFYDGPWFDLGTPEHYLQANLDLLSGRLRLRNYPPGMGAEENGVLRAAGLTIPDSARLGPEVALGAGCQIGTKAQLSRSVIWPGCRVPDGAQLDRCIHTPEHQLQL